MIFVLYKREAAALQSTLSSRGYNVTAIHGDMNQNDRTAALAEFKSGRYSLLFIIYLLHIAYLLFIL